MNKISARLFIITYMYLRTILLLVPYLIIHRSYLLTVYCSKGKLCTDRQRREWEVVITFTIECFVYF